MTRKKGRTPAPTEGGRRERCALTKSDVLALFEEQAYLHANPDVAAAVAEGMFSSGRDHFVRFGLEEGRPPRPADRRTRLLGELDPARLRGAEIGVLNRPTVRKDEGAIIYIDHTDREGLLQTFGHTDMDLSTILEVDAVWGERRLLDCLPGRRPVDYVIASHVVEHVPDLLGWLAEVRDALAPSGQLRLAVPDRRYTFDRLRRESDLADVLDAYLRRARTPLPRAVLEFVLHTRAVRADMAWLGLLDPEALRGSQNPSVAHAMSLAGEVLEGGRYVDSHCWVFTPRSFAGLMEALCTAGLHPFECTDFHDTVVYDLEFFVGLRPADDHAQAATSWRRMRDAAAL